MTTSPSFTKEYSDYCDRKLKHYNFWLMDMGRELGTPYPGFPEDIPAGKMSKTTVVNKIATRTVRVSTKGATKADRAVEILRSNSKLARVNLIALLQQQLGMSKAGATTYYYNAMKKLGYA
jgi:hypothetical protein